MTFSSPPVKEMQFPCFSRMTRRAAVSVLLLWIGTTVAICEETAKPAEPASAQAPPLETPTSTLLTGLDVLQRDGFVQLKGQRVGLITNHTGVNRRGESLVKILQDAPEVDLTALFSPEHGFAGILDQARIDDQQDSTTGLRIFSLYGKTRKPTPDSLANVDTLVFDIQDIGARFYTYISTMGLAMQAAAKQKIRFVVLDRPNPINGISIQGPVLDAGSESFVGFHPIPVRHGMTVGELAQMLKQDLNLDLDLTVVPVEGWQRDEMYDSTGLLWINPSPNMRNLTQALLYPGIGLIETTNVSVGRGTDTPFEIIGAPWLQPLTFAAGLNLEGLPGVRFVPLQFTPQSSKYAAQICGGVRIIVTDQKQFDSLRTGLTVAVHLRRHYPTEWETKSLNRLLNHKATYDGIIAGKSVDDLQAGYWDGLEKFIQHRKAFLIYPQEG